MVIDHRTYTFRPGTLKQWLEKYETEGLPIQKNTWGNFWGCLPPKWATCTRSFLCGDMKVWETGNDAAPKWRPIRNGKILSKKSGPWESSRRRK